MGLPNAGTTAIYAPEASAQPTTMLNRNEKMAMNLTHDKDKPMGYSTPKKPFDLTEFLNQKGKPPFARKPAWNRRPAVTPNAPDAPIEPGDRRMLDPV